MTSGAGCLASLRYGTRLHTHFPPLQLAFNAGGAFVSAKDCLRLQRLIGLCGVTHAELDWLLRDCVCVVQGGDLHSGPMTTRTMQAMHDLSGPATGSNPAGSLTGPNLGGAVTPITLLVSKMLSEEDGLVSSPVSPPPPHTHTHTTLGFAPQLLSFQ